MYIVDGSIIFVLRYKRTCRVDYLSTNIRSRSEHEGEDQNVLVIFPPTKSPIISRWHESSAASMRSPILMKRSRPQDCVLTRQLLLMRQPQKQKPTTRIEKIRLKIENGKFQRKISHVGFIVQFLHNPLGMCRIRVPVKFCPIYCIPGSR